MPDDKSPKINEDDKLPVVMLQPGPDCCHSNKISIKIDSSELKYNDKKLKKASDTYARGSIDEAEILLKELLKEYPDNIEAHLMLGDIYERKMMYNEAIEEYNIVLRLNEKDEFTKFKLNNALRQNKAKK
jgi:predicted Zn-dependent protease